MSLQLNTSLCYAGAFQMSWANVLEKEGNQFNRDRSHFQRVLGSILNKIMNFFMPNKGNNIPNQYHMKSASALSV